MAAGRGGRGIFQYGRHSDYKDCYWKNEAKSQLDTVLNCHFSYVCLFNFPSKQNMNIFRVDLTEFRGSFYFRSKLCQLDI